MYEAGPWVVRHIYSTADQSFEQYVNEARDLLARAERAGWISERHDMPVKHDSEIMKAASGMEPGELLMADLHGWADQYGGYLATKHDNPGLNLADIPAASWHPAAYVFSSCRGGHERFLQELARVISGTAAVFGHCGEVEPGFPSGPFHNQWDRTPIEIVQTILREAASGDESAAFTAMHRIASTSQSGQEWIAELLTPVPGN